MAHRNYDILTAVLLAAEEVASRNLARAGPAPPIRHARYAGSREGDGDALDRGALAQILSLAEYDVPGLDQIPAAFGDAEMLVCLFRNLFPEHASTLAPRPGSERLTEREIEVLKQSQGGDSAEKLAERLGIAAQTINVHRKHIYRKLGVRSLSQAVAEAAAQGYPGLELATQAIRTYRGHARGPDPFRTFCVDVASLDPPLDAATLDPSAARLAHWGLFLLAAGAALARHAHGMRHGGAQAPGAVAQVRIPPVSATGAAQDGASRLPTDVIRLPAHVGEVRSIVVVPSHAAAHGFTPGNLLLAHDLYVQVGLNRGAITEITPQGEFVSTFCGARDAAARLVGPLCLCFHPDGRLLGTTGWLADAILVFTEGGDTVNRFAPGCYTQISLGADGCLYGALNATPGPDTPAHILDSSGVLVDKLGPLPSLGVREAGPHPGEAQAPARMEAHAIAVLPGGAICIARKLTNATVIEIYDRDARRLGSIAPVGFEHGHLTALRSGTLAVPCCHSGDLCLIAPHGSETRAPLPSELVPLCVTEAEQGALWVGGYVSSGQG